MQTPVCDTFLIWQPVSIDYQAALGKGRIVLVIEVEREDDGRWLAELPALPGVLAYGTSAEDAKAKVKVLARRVIADRCENGELLSS